MPRDTAHLTLVYACSGCSSAAQLANHLAVRLDREGDAEMSCIAGVGGRVPSLVRKLQDAVQQGRPILAIDGCALSCVKASLAQHQVKATVHLQLGQQGVNKAYHADFDKAQAEALLQQVKAQAQSMNDLHALANHASTGGGCGGSGPCRCAGERQVEADQVQGQASPQV